MSNSKQVTIASSTGLSVTVCNHDDLPTYHKKLLDDREALTEKVKELTEEVHILKTTLRIHGLGRQECMQRSVEPPNKDVVT